MTRDETDEPAARSERSGALERRDPGRVATKTAEALPDTAAGSLPETKAGSLPGTAAEETPAKDVEPSAGTRRRRPLRTSLIVVVAIAVAAAAGIAATGTLGGDGNDPRSSAPSGPPATAEVERTTLVDSETVDGNLGYGEAQTVRAPASSADTGTGTGSTGQGGGSGGDGGNGIVTWLPEEGDVVKRGDTVYRVDQREVPLLYGSFPLYRTLRPGTEGADVEMLEKNLRALGYSGFIVDDTYNSSTAQAVRDWQDDLNRKETGTVEPGDALVASGARRVADVQAAPGVALSGNLLTWTGTERIVGVDLDVQFEDLVDNGTKATVELPDGNTVQGEVTDIGTPSTSRGDDSASGTGESDAGSGGSGGNEDPTLPVELTVKDQKGLGRYQAAAVEVTLKAETREDVLVVPVNALVARKGGGYALEVVTGDSTEYHPVKLGMFADGRVEVSGTGIKEGTVVGVPK
ncbi:peptidoglycan-binding domain-containing protein [Streptomyces sp. KN37]|uniref:peptidoglycan-binding domain-containing protein n=1 Tax=Streptomyces sp. KN37 TaxID=3090667 RepID=UPI002A75B9A2|nr:peptidoglycan-binding domain-containing protein [Streptomyces sp. KN37]WPO69546.1 peptidoglycan-binding domain-containing protein [Streptomyces sp. KN37]